MFHQKTLRLILGDQLNIQHSWFQKVDPNITYVLMELRSETDYALHHIQKVLGFFGAMRAFAEQLTQQHHQVIYIRLNDDHHLQRFDENCLCLIQQHHFTKFEYQLPDEYRLDEHLKSFSSKLSISTQVHDSEHFYCTRNELKDLFSNRSSYLMENFYRHMRKKHKVLTDDNQKPLFGKWNFDEDNRKKLPRSHQSITPFLFTNDLSEIENEINKSGIKTIGTANSKQFFWPINREQSLQLLEFFVENCLKQFGTYQDAMATGEWTLYHSRLSFSMNIKLISPKEVVDKAIEHYFNHTDDISFHQLEGFVRQIIGWREYMRGIYWAEMPRYAALNYFEHQRKLPSWYWTGDTKMNCLKQSIKQSLQYAYAHHIQRLMITGNFALLAGVHPDHVDAWYLGIYIDAIEWVEITNTRGMSQFADGGIVGTKPYVSSAAYIHKMSNYCEGCHYDKNKKTGEGACPFNSLYWNFYHQHESKLSANPRIGMMYNVWRKMDKDQQTSMIQQAEYYLENIETL